MKKLLWTSAVALTAAACMTACDDSGSGASNSIPEYKSEFSLPDTCEMEIAKVDTAYFACFENKWIEVTDSTTIEQLKEGLDEEEIKAKLEELQSLLPKPADNTPKPTSSSAQSEVEGSDDEEDSSSSSEEEESSSSSKKKKDKDKDDSGSGSGDDDDTSSPSSTESSSPSSAASLNRDAHFSVLDDYVTWDEDGKTATFKVSVDATAFLNKIKDAGFNYVIPTTTDETNASALQLKILGSDLTIEEGWLFAALTEYTKTDSSVFVFVTKKSQINTGVHTFIAPMGKCGDEAYAKLTQFCDERDYQIYNFVTIGTGKSAQTWMAENLNYKTSEVTSDCYDNICSVYGRLYTYAASIGKTEAECGFGHSCTLEGNVQGVCPTGWHLPSNDEFETLLTNVGGADVAGKALKSTTGWNASGNGTDAYHFTALPGGIRSYSDGYVGKGDYTWFRSSTPSEINQRAFVLVFSSKDGVLLSDANIPRDGKVIASFKDDYAYIRCIKD